MKSRNIYRQGDILLLEVRLPRKKLKRKFSGKKYVLAYGEITGHKHLLVSDIPSTKFEILEDDQGRKYLKLDNPAILTHEEHKALKIEPAIYIIKREREYDYFEEEIRSIMD